jgi:hypothetical protein
MFRQPEGRSERKNLRPHETGHLTANPVEIFFSSNFHWILAMAGGRPRPSSEHRDAQTASAFDMPEQSTSHFFVFQIGGTVP